MRISDWSSDVCSSDLRVRTRLERGRDGVDFGARQGARRERCRSIVTDAGRRLAPKSARRFAVARGSPPSVVACLRVASATRLRCAPCRRASTGDHDPRSEEHTSELQSLMRISYAVFCLNKKTQASNARLTQQIMQ